MSNQNPKMNVDILVLRENKILLGLLTKEWLYKAQQVYGVPGRDLYFKETIGDCVNRNMREELDCKVVSHEIISVNANYEFGNHYIGIGVVIETSDEPKLMKPQDWERGNGLPLTIFLKIYFHRQKILSSVFYRKRFVFPSNYICFNYCQTNP